MSTFIERPTKWAGFMPALITAVENGGDSGEEAKVLLTDIAEELDKHNEARAHGSPMRVESFYYDTANSDDKTAYIDVLGGATVAIEIGKDGVSVSIYSAFVSDRHVAHTSATWAAVNPDEQETGDVPED